MGCHQSCDLCLLVHHVVKYKCLYSVCAKVLTSVGMGRCLMWKVKTNISKYEAELQSMIQCVIKPSFIEYWWCIIFLFLYFCSTPTSLTSFLVHLQCSKSCGRGLRKRSVFCRSTDPGAKAVVVPDSMCRQHHKPKAQETCVLRRCPKNERLQWNPTQWGEVRKKRRKAPGAVVIEVTQVVFSFGNLRKNLPWSTWILSEEPAFVDALALSAKCYSVLLRMSPNVGDMTSHGHVPSTAPWNISKHPALMSVLTFKKTKDSF